MHPTVICVRYDYNRISKKVQYINKPNPRSGGANWKDPCGHRRTFKRRHSWRVRDIGNRIAIVEIQGTAYLPGHLLWVTSERAIVLIST